MVLLMLLLMRVWRNVFLSLFAQSLSAKNTRPVRRGHPASTIATQIAQRNQSLRPLPFQLLRLQPPIRQASPLPTHLTSPHLPLRCIPMIELPRDLQLPHKQRARILGQFTNRRVRPLPHRLRELALVLPGLLARVAALGAAVGVAVEGAAEGAGSLGAGGQGWVVGAGDVVFVAAGQGPGMG